MPLRITPTRDRTVYRLFRNGEQIALRRGQRIYKPGDDANDIYLVEEGHVRLVLPPLRGAPGRVGRSRDDVTAGRKGSRTARGRVGGLVGVSEVFGLESVTGSIRLYGAVAGESTIVRRASGPRFLKVVRRTRWTLPQLLAALERDLRATRWGLSAHAPARARVARALLSIDGRFVPGEGQGGIPRRLSHSEVADVAGVHRSTVTTIVNEWIYDGVLEELRSDRLLRIRDGAALRREAYLE